MIRCKKGEGIMRRVKKSLLSLFPFSIKGIRIYIPLLFAPKKEFVQEQRLTFFYRKKGVLCSMYTQLKPLTCRKRDYTFASDLETKALVF